MPEFLNLVSIVPWEMVAQLLNLLILTLLVKKFLFVPVQNIIAQRQAAADEMLTNARTVEQEAQDAKAAYEKSIAGAKQEAAQIVEDATRTASRHSDEMIAAAADSTRRMKERAEAEIEQERKKALNEVRDEIGGMAMDIASKVVEREISQQDHQNLIDEFIKSVGEES